MATSSLLQPTSISPQPGAQQQTRDRCPNCGGASVCWCNYESEDVSAETHRMLEQDFFDDLRGGRP